MRCGSIAPCACFSPPIAPCSATTAAASVRHAPLRSLQSVGSRIQSARHDTSDRSGRGGNIAQNTQSAGRMVSTRDGATATAATGNSGRSMLGDGAGWQHGMEETHESKGEPMERDDRQPSRRESATADRKTAREQQHTDAHSDSQAEAHRGHGQKQQGGNAAKAEQRRRECRGARASEHFHQACLCCPRVSRLRRCSCLPPPQLTLLCRCCAPPQIPFASSAPRLMSSLAQQIGQQPNSQRTQTHTTTAERTTTEERRTQANEREARGEREAAAKQQKARRECG